MSRYARALALPLVFSLVAGLLAFYPLCLDTYRILLDEDAPLNIQGEIGQRYPIPRSLFWSPATKNLVVSLTLLQPGAVIALAIGLFSILIYCVLKALNPTFRLTTGVDWDQKVLTETYIHTPPLIKAFLIAIAALIPLFIVWALLVYVGGGFWLIVTLGSVLTGSVAWLLFSRDGVAGDYESLNYGFPRDSATRISLLARGAAAGAAAAVIIRLWAMTSPGMLFDFYASLGSIGEAHWRSIVLITCGSSAFLGFTGALFLRSLAPPKVDNRTRLSAGIAGVAAILMFAIVRGYVLPRYLISKYDYDPARNAIDSSGISRAARSLAARTGVPIKSEGMNTLITFRRGEAVAWNVPSSAVTGLDASIHSASRIESYLAGKGYATSLADAAFKTLHDAASLKWDNRAGLELELRNLERAPDAHYIRLVVARFRSSPSAPEVLSLADRLADESRFVYVTRASRMTMGDIYARLGEKDKAAVWYRKADVPESRIPDLLAERTMFADGTISGRLLLNGAPLEGAKVGLAPLSAIGEAFRTMISRGVIRPFWLRWIGPTAVTDASGGFRIGRVTAGEYRMIVAHPRIQLRPFDQDLFVDSATGRLFVGFGRPTTSLGDIDIRIPVQLRGGDGGIDRSDPTR